LLVDPQIIRRSIRVEKMAFFTLAEVRAPYISRYSQKAFSKDAAVFNESQEKKYPSDHRFNIFLSHSRQDVELDPATLAGVRHTLENEFQQEVYVDWTIDKHLSRDDVNPATADVLRNRMNHSDCLFFATSENSANSKWMPWELGYMDGKKSMVAILPLLNSAGGTTHYKEQEYLGLYPYVDKAPSAGKNYLWINNDASTYVNYSDWLKGKKPYKH
jgi:hypothetical protein